MNFYDFCLLSEKTVYDAITYKDKFLYAYLLPDESFDFSHIKNDDNVGTITFNSKEMSDNNGVATVQPALLYTPKAGVAGRAANAYKLDLFHLARDKSDSNAAEIFKNEFYSATVYKTLGIVKEFKPSLIIYLDSKSPFNKDVVAQLHQVHVLSIDKLKTAKPLPKRTYGFIAQELAKDPSNIKRFVIRTDGTRGQITSIALQTIIQNLVQGKQYMVKGNPITIDSPLSRQITAAMIAQEWNDAANELAANGVALAPTDFNIGRDLTKVLEFLTSYGHFDSGLFRQPIPDPDKPERPLVIKRIVVVDDNINSCSTYDEVNKILKAFDQTRNAEIKWVVGIMAAPSEKVSSCFYKKKK